MVEPDKRIVFRMTESDLMWAAEVNFVYEMKSGDLTQVCADQWFKGE